MIRFLFRVSATLCALIGVAHTIVTFFLFHTLSQRALYFAGTGFAILILVMFNVAIAQSTSPTRLSRNLLHAANALMSIFAVLAIIAVPEPQAYVGASAMWGLLVSAILLERKGADT